MFYYNRESKNNPKPYTCVEKSLPVKGWHTALDGNFGAAWEVPDGS